MTGILEYLILPRYLGSYCTSWSLAMAVRARRAHADLDLCRHFCNICSMLTKHGSGVQIGLACMLNWLVLVGLISGRHMKFTAFSTSCAEL